MNAKTFNQHLLYMQNITACTLIAKAQEYATDEDRLHNFKIAAPLQSRTPVGALGGFMAKHTISLYDMICGTDKGTDFSLNMWEEKIKDHINYLFLLWGLVNERDEIIEALKAGVEALNGKAAQCAITPESVIKAPETVIKTAEIVIEKPAPATLDDETKHAIDAMFAKPEVAKKQKSAIVNADFEAATLEMDMHLQERKLTAAEGLGDLDEAKLRHKTQVALLNFLAKNEGSTTPIIRRAGGRITDATLRAMASDNGVFAVKHWMIADTALRKLALDDIKQDESTENADTYGKIRRIEP